MDASRWKNKRQHFLSIVLVVSVVNCQISNAFNLEIYDNDFKAGNSRLASLTNIENPSQRVKSNEMEYNPTGSMFDSQTTDLNEKQSSFGVKDFPVVKNDISHNHKRSKIGYRELNYILDEQDGYKVSDPRVLLTGERLTTALNMIDKSLDTMKETLILPYLLRTSIEVGRKMYSQLPKIAKVAQTILTTSETTPNPNATLLTSRMADTILRALDKDDEDYSTSDNNREAVTYHQLNIANSNNDDYHLPNESRLMRDAMFIVGREMAHWLNELTQKGMASVNQLGGSRERYMKLILEAVAIGMRQMQADTDREVNQFKTPEQQKNYIRALYEGMSMGFDETLKSDKKGKNKSYKHLSGKITVSRGQIQPNKVYGDINMAGMWNRHLFSDITSPERLIKVLSGILRRIRGEARQHDFIDKNMPNISQRFQLALQEFVERIVDFNSQMLSSATGNTTHTLNGDDSSPTRPIITTNDKSIEMQEHENKIPALCFAIGRRWRLILSRGPTSRSRNQIISNLAQQISKARNPLELTLGTRLCVLCLPRLEAGWKGWGINGEEKSRETYSLSSGAETLVELKDMLGENPLHLKDLKNPFAAGAIMGFNLGSKIGYNSARNTTLELERSDRLHSSISDNVLRSSARAGMVEGAKKAFESSVIEGYKVGLKLSPKAGIIITRRAASTVGKTIGSTIGANFGGVAGRMAAAKVQGIVDDNSNAPNLLQMAQSAGEDSGSDIGMVVGTIAAMMAASDAYMRLVLSRGKLTNVRFFFNEFTNGAKAGFETGLKGGAVAADSVILQQVAPAKLKIEIPRESDVEQIGEYEDPGDGSYIAMPQSALDELVARRGTSTNSGKFKGNIKSKLSEKEEILELLVELNGYSIDGTIYATLNGTSSGMGHFSGYLFADLLSKSNGSFISAGEQQKDPSSINITTEKPDI